VAAALAAAVAAERLGIVAGLIRATRDWELAEDSVQDAIERALQRWPADGIPANPGGWLRVTAQRRATDVLRRRHIEQGAVEQVEAMTVMTTPRPDPEDEGPYGDDRLRLLFACCHPALPLGGRVALTLRTVLGRPIRDIARVFLVSEATMSQRILRTRTKIQHAGISLRVPEPHRLAERMTGVRAVIYLLFTDGYPTTEADPLRDEVAREAIDLAGLVSRLLPDDDETHALRSLMLFQQSRRAARTDEAGEPLTMEEQDRSRWDQRSIGDGLEALDRARATDRPAGPYRLQAEIAALHATATRADATDWVAIVRLFDALLALQPSPVVALNRAVAIAFRDGPVVGLGALDAVEAAGGSLDAALVTTIRADLLRRAGRVDEARAAFRDAHATTPDGPERRLIARRIRELG
jgi:RNA polymerase sigma-70 factor (ECF subfamily)